MATSNFTMQKDFDLWVYDFSLPIYLADENDEINEQDEPIDYTTDFFTLNIVQDKLDELNRTLSYFSVSLEDGHYSHTQFYVSEKDGVEIPTYYTAQEWRENRRDYCGKYYYPMPYSLTMRAYKAEINKINKWFATVGARLGFEQIVCVGTFSNGESVYCRADSQRAKIYSAVA